jgi:hypothetical protein
MRVGWDGRIGTDRIVGASGSALLETTTSSDGSDGVVRATIGGKSGSISANARLLGATQRSDGVKDAPLAAMSAPVGAMGSMCGGMVRALRAM